MAWAIAHRAVLCAGQCVRDRSITIGNLHDDYVDGKASVTMATVCVVVTGVAMLVITVFSDGGASGRAETNRSIDDNMYGNKDCDVDVTADEVIKCMVPCEQRQRRQKRQSWAY